MVALRAEIRMEAVTRTGQDGGVKGLRARFIDSAPLLPYRFSQRVAKYVRAAAPIRTGTLKKSVKRETISKGVHQVTVEAFYGIYVNYGTRYMHAQPFWEPSIDQALADFREDAKKVLHGGALSKVEGGDDD